ncbi:MAG: hypothetical protein H7A33_07050 [Deltaproteobacteria bacterium]|nr:hypothetical protein [Deltaproteobacteria bacterium]
MSGFKINSEQMAKLAGRLSYLSARHNVLVQNVANLETNDYKAKDLEFKGYLDQQTQDGQALKVPDVKMTTSSADPDAKGNNVVVEQQMADLADNSVEFFFATELIKKNLAMLKYASAG